MADRNYLHASGRRVLSGVLLLLIIVLLPAGQARSDDSGCVDCHTDIDLLAEFVEESENTGGLLQSGAGYGGPAARLEPQQRVLVSEDFLDSEHGEVGCVFCHGGDETAPDMESAHDGVDPYPSRNAMETCGECHEEIAETASASLHAMLSTFPGFLKERTSAAYWTDIDNGRERHCAECHASCGDCHVSRPRSVGTGFIDGHLFSARPDSLNQCMACHDRRIGDEFIGVRGQGDVHLKKYSMTCIDCHGAEELHAAAPEGLKNRYHLEEAANCTDCHEGLQFGSVRDHRIHHNRVQCQVCHSQTYTNCFSCHARTDENGIAYNAAGLDYEDMKIGFNLDRIPGNNYKFVLLRHVPVDPGLFAEYVQGGLDRFDVAPTWKRTSPHNIRRRTWQNASCNNCHGQRDLFLSEDDLLDYEEKANFGVTVRADQIPKPRSRIKPLDIDTSRVIPSRVVDVSWLREHGNKEGIVLLDARTADLYDQGHIPGAISFDPNMAQGLCQPARAHEPLQLESDEVLGRTFGDHGMTVADHIVVYSDSGPDAGFILAVLDYVGAENISLLSGGIAAWEQAGFELSRERVEPEAKIFVVSPRTGQIVHNDFVKANLNNPLVVFVDVGTLQQSVEALDHPRTRRPGRLPGSTQMPINGLYEDHSYIKDAEELLWVLKERNIPPHKTIVVSGNTGWRGAGAQFMLRYLGYPDVRLHDEAWTGWMD